MSLFFINSLSAQESIEENAAVRTALDEMFENLNKGRIITGFLQDYAVDLVDFHNYDGVLLTDSNYVDANTFVDILKSVKSSSVRDQSALFSNLPSVMNDFSALKVADTLNIAFMLFKYNYIKQNALEDALIAYNETTDKVSEVFVDGIFQNPYAFADLFAFSPSSNVSSSTTVVYEFNDQHIFRNQNYVGVRFDPGDGNGYRSINEDSSVSVTYSSGGIKELKLRLTVSDLNVLEAHSNILVQDPVVTKTDFPSSQLDSFTVYKTYNGKNIGAEVKYHSCQSDGEIRKPFIVVEGFEPLKLQVIKDGTLSQEEYLQGFTTLNSLLNSKEDFMKSRIYLEYDIVYVDWFDSTEDIRANASLLTDILDEINTRKKAAGSTEKNILMGQSMGGLVARFALKTMENENHKHEVSTYISHDSPHWGANVPLGALYFVNQVTSCLHGFGALTSIADLFTGGKLTDMETAIYNTINSPAARQMLLNYVNSANQLDNSIHYEWISILRELGFPDGDEGEGIENLAIVNGRDYNYSSHLVGNNNLLELEGEFVTSIASRMLIWLLGPVIDIPLFTSVSRINANGMVKPFVAANTGKALSVLSVTYTKKFLWKNPKIVQMFYSSITAPSTGLYYDGYPGSTYCISPIGSGDIDSGWGEISYTVEAADQIMFIPVASALAINQTNLTESHFTRDYYVSNPEPKVETPFDAYYLCGSTTNHIFVNSTMLEWLYNHINTEISGPDYIMEPTTYSIPGYSGTLEWSSSDESVATIDDDGTVTPVGAGNVVITAESYTNGKYYRKIKMVAVNFPDLYINCTYTSGTGFEFIAECSDSQETPLLNSLVSSGILQYEWSLFDGEGNMLTQTGASNTMPYLPKDNDVVTVAVRLVDVASGDKSTIKSTSINLRMPFATTYKYTVVTADQTVYYVKSDGTYEIDNPSASFGVKYLSTGYSADDNILYTQGMVKKYLKGNNCYLAYPVADGWGYWTGVRSGFGYQWTFDFFDSSMYTDKLQSALSCACGEEHLMDPFELVICNSQQEPMQRLPFAIICKPTFPGN